MFSDIVKSDIVKSDFFELNEGEYDKGEFPEHYKFKYELDHFQKFGFKAISLNNNILVTAHTGAGKTALALYGIQKTLSEEKMVIYTSPIKTLSNQKYSEFKEDFDNVGILTGDIKINPSGNLLIMTAEILRNSIVRTKDETIVKEDEWNFDPDKVACVILDEVHYINNKDRGMVWDEIIMNLKPEVQLIMLSATINGAEKFARWVGNLKQKKCHLIPTPFRPVPLQHYLYYDEKLFLIKDKTWKNNCWGEIMENLKNPKFKRNCFKFELNRLLKFLRENEGLPTNIFLLNRILAEKTAEYIELNFNDFMETSEINRIWDEKLRKFFPIYSENKQWIMVKKLAEKGIGVHHSGLIPILKDIVEILYSKKLIKVLIATETFAMGVNMPTKTTIFTDYEKFDGNKKRLLYPEEYNQMAGRAGRRGLDDFGQVIIIPPYKNTISEKEAKYMICAEPTEIASKFNINVNYILKQLLVTNNMEEIYESVKYSFKMIDKKKQLKFLETDLKKSMEKSSLLKKPDNYDEFIEFIELENKGKGFFKLSKKDSKKLARFKKIFSLNNLNVKENKNYHKFIKEIQDKEDELKREKINTRVIIDEYIKYFKFIGFVDEENNLTFYGKMAANINNYNILVVRLINNKIFETLEFREIVALLSLIVNNNENKNKVEFNKEFEESIIQTNQEMEHIYNQLIENYSIYHEIEYIVINDMNYSAVHDWADGKDWKEIEHDDFEGNFIKTILRITNILREIYKLFEITKNEIVLNKLFGFEEKLIRDFVTTDSLYL